jgi:hypothetical protein
LSGTTVDCGNITIVSYGHCNGMDAVYAAHCEWGLGACTHHGESEIGGVYGVPTGPGTRYGEAEERLREKHTSA